MKQKCFYELTSSRLKLETQARKKVSPAKSHKLQKETSVTVEDNRNWTQTHIYLRGLHSFPKLRQLWKNNIFTDEDVEWLYENTPLMRVELGKPAVTTATPAFGLNRNVLKRLFFFLIFQNKNIFIHF